MIRPAFLLACSLLVAIPATASAQSTAGNIVGQARPGDSVIISGDTNGYKREIQVGKDGRYKVRRIPIGKYNVVFMHADGKIDTVQGVVIRPEGTTTVSSNGAIVEGGDRFSRSDAY